MDPCDRGPDRFLQGLGAPWGMQLGSLGHSQLEFTAREDDSDGVWPRGVEDHAGAADHAQDRPGAAVDMVGVNIQTPHLCRDDTCLGVRRFFCIGESDRGAYMSVGL